MSILNRILNYWYDCIKNEDILGKDISIHVRTRAVLNPFNHDPFIFNTDLEPLDVLGNLDNNKIINFAAHAFTKEYEIYYGFPLLYYNEFDEYLKREKCLVAPLFVTRMKYFQEEGRFFLDTDENFPSCGIMAFNKLGLKTEEINDIGQKIEKIFTQDLDPQSLFDESIKIIQNEAEITINEEINPLDLSKSKKIRKGITPGIYNSNILFLGENTVFNFSLLRDLSELKEKTDLEETALSFLSNLSKDHTNKTENNSFIPIIPFASNEYQINAMKKVFQNKLTVITGPPGTGKSQFISNLLINFFLEGKTVLFVSHTNEAVDIVNQKINEQFSNLIMRTGKKEYRQELKAKFSELLIYSSKPIVETVTKEDIKTLWERIDSHRDEINRIDRLKAEYERNYVLLNDIMKYFYQDLDLETFKEKFLNQHNAFSTLDNMIKELKKIEENRFSILEKIYFFILPFLKNKKIKVIKKEINLLLLESGINKFITDNTEIVSDLIEKRKERNRHRLENLLRAFNIFVENRKIYNDLVACNSRLKIEESIKELEEKLVEYSRKYIRAAYLKNINTKQKYFGAVNAFLNELSTSRMIDDIGGFFTKEAMGLLKIWSSTLKSVGRSFPLKPGIFDYVIFDEASQVDLPSAAPALYRGKKAIVVGDPKQLTHISGITRNMDKDIAKTHKLIEEKDYYPSKIRYYDTSLYFSAENSSFSRPVFLNNHYRSEDGIIGLCNTTFYDERLKIMTPLDFSRIPASLPIGVHWVDCKGEVYKHPAGSRLNIKEVEVVQDLYSDILKKIDKTDLTIGIVTPYRRQADRISDAISSVTELEKLEKHSIKSMTAHKFQGSERDIIIFSLVLASKGNGNSDTWYNIYPQILNVALSRAKYLLYIVGDKSFAKNHSCSYKDKCILKKLVHNYDEMKKEENYEKVIFGKKLDSPVEQYLFEKMQDIDFENYGYRLVPKFVFKRYTLDFALIPNIKNKARINIECDGKQHQVIEGVPILEDIERDNFLEEHGWTILRFQNFNIRENTEEVLKKIVESMKSQNYIN